MREGSNKSIAEDKNNLIEAYRNYLEDFDCIAANSKKSYISYVKNAIRHFEKHYHNEINFYETVKHEFDNTCTLVNDYLNKIKNKEVDDVSSKTASNYFSAFILFQDMLNDNYKCNNKKKELENYVKNVKNIIYSKKNLDKVFLQRLRTQDRDFEVIKFPTRILSKELKEWFTDKLKESLEEMTLYDENKKEYKYKDVKKIELNNEKGYVYIYLKNKPRAIKLYTPDSGYKKYRKFDPQKGLADITLDHEKALENIIKQCNKSYPRLKDLSDTITVEIITTPNGKKRKKYKLEDKSMFNDDLFVKGLKVDINLIFEDIHLVAMSGSENSAKGKNSLSK